MENSRQRHNFHGCAHTHPQHLTISLSNVYNDLGASNKPVEFPKVPCSISVKSQNNPKIHANLRVEEKSNKVSMRMTLPLPAK